MIFELIQLKCKNNNFMNKIKLLSAIELGINHMTQEETLHFAHVVSTLMEAYTSKSKKAVIFFFEGDMDEVEFIPINSDENETNKFLKFISEIQSVGKSYDS